MSRFRRALPFIFGGAVGVSGLAFPLFAKTACAIPPSAPGSALPDALPEQRSLTSVVCFMGSSVGAKTEYASAAEALGRAMSERGISLVYGGGSRGLMGVLARTCADAGASVIGYMPELLAPYEVAGESIGELHVVSTMHERKAAMCNKGEAFIALPGGYGTLEELFEVATWAMLGYHNKPIGLLNVNGFWDPLLKLVDHMIEEKFVQPKYRDLIVVDSDPHALLDKLQSHRMPVPIITRTFGKIEAT